MADVKIHKCFPTTIYQFEYHPSIDDYKNMETHISETRKNYRYHTDDDLHKQLQFIKLREKIYEVSKQYFNNLDRTMIILLICRIINNLHLITT